MKKQKKLSADEARTKLAETTEQMRRNIAEAKRILLTLKQELHLAEEQVERHKGNQRLVEGQLTAYEKMLALLTAKPRKVQSGTEA